MPVRIGCLVLIFTHLASASMPAVAWASDEPAEITATVVIRGRQFTPDRTILRKGQKTRLLFTNQDSELHTFAPAGLFAGESFNVSGNGAPEFSPEGLKRIIIPPDGAAEIRFTPSKPGEFPYVCDMPGHQMSAVILVE